MSAPASPSARAPRFRLCTSERVGVGDLSTVALAGAVTAFDHATTALVITGAPIAPGTGVPPRVGTVALPLLSRHPVYGLGAHELVIDSGAARALRASMGGVAGAAA